jgi:Ribonuclease G/E
VKGVQHAFGTVQGHAVGGLIVDGRLEDFVVDTDAPRPGTIYRAKAVRPAKGQGGMFLETPDGSAFLRNAKGVATGKTLLVQVTGYAERGKAVPVSDRLLFKGRYAIITPGKPGINIARSIKDDEARVALREAADVFADDLGGCGLIIRSAAAGMEAEEVQGDIAACLDAALAILGDSDTAVEKLIEGPDVAELAYREWPEGSSGGDINACFETAMRPELALPGGGRMTVEATRALVAVDVDTGGDTSPAAGLKANIAAARNLMRLLRIKGLGGQVVVDFAPMPKRDRRTLESTLQAQARADAIETALVGWTTMGLYELNRKRGRAPLHEVFR